ncbi:MAG: family 16 glycosylhydrolase [Candidatus Marinimicrobia bacterium]|nr:family 16 glycosylhydrolase [Candidatus Neomarinimicrobiota bacterium]
MFTRNNYQIDPFLPSLKFILLSLLLASLSVITAKDFRGAELRTFESFTYGRFEVKMRSARGSGLLSSFFTYHDGGLGWNELDVEILGQKNNEVQFNAITPGQVNHVFTKRTSYSPHDSYHIYAFEWTPEYLAWFIDGVEVHRQTGNHVQTLIHPQKIMMNIWQSESVSWVGEFDPDILPVFAYYDWVKYYSYTPDSGDYGTDGDFTHSWTDDFKVWDQDRWAKATHTFGGNNVDFIHENISFYNGNMILCLTQPDDVGYDPVFPPFDQSLHLYNDFESNDSFQWFRWNGLDSKSLRTVPNPHVSSANPSNQVLEVIRLNSYTYFYTPLPEELDLSESHTFAMQMLVNVPNTTVTFKLQNNRLASPTSNEVTSKRLVEKANEWTKLYFDFSPALNRLDFNQIVIQVSDDNGIIDTCYIDGLYGPPILSTGLHEDIPTPKNFNLRNYPNPFNASTTFAFSVPEASQVDFDVYDIRGNQVADIVSDFLSQGEYRYNWPVGNLGSGVYFSRLRFNNKVHQRKILLLR